MIEFNEIKPYMSLVNNFKGELILRNNKAYFNDEIIAVCYKYKKDNGKTNKKSRTNWLASFYLYFKSGR